MDTDAHRLRIGDGRDWHFVNATWQDGPDNALVVPDEHLKDDGYSLQGHHYAFHRDSCYQDVRVRFEFKLTPHSDIGIILRARDERQFYLLHFPDCGQASRAQHFWAAFSKMDVSGFHRIIKLEMVRRVPSVPRNWMTADLILRQSRITVNIADHGYFEAEDSTYTGSGRLGVYLNGGAAIRNVRVDGEPTACPPWDDGVRQPTNWFHPFPSDEKPSQWPHDVMRLPDGNLLLSWNEHVRTGKDDELLTRNNLSWSSDGGRSWSASEPLGAMIHEEGWARPRVHLTTRGRLIAIMRGPDSYYIRDSADSGHTWGEPERVNIPLSLPGIDGLHVGPQVFVNLADGGLVFLGHGGYDLRAQDLHMLTYGNLHCQGFACRSGDDGRTWSEVVNLDNMGPDGQGKQIDGNLGLTEGCGVEMGDGKIMVLIRPCYSPWMWETWSHDGGRTWGPCLRGPFPGYATPNMLRTSSGAVLVAHRLPSMTIHCSRDDGHTWDNGTQIDSGLWAMGTMCQVEPDVVLFLYNDSYERLMRAQYLRVTATSLDPIAPP